MVCPFMLPNSNKYVNSIFFLSTSFLMLLASAATINSKEAAILSLEMVSVSSTSVDLIFLADPTSLVFLSLVCFIAASVMTYGQEYMGGEVDKNRLSGLLILFILSMAALIITPNIITMLLGWDGLGIVSFVLVLYYNNHASSGAAMITALTNRIGDILIIISIGAHLSAGHWDLLSMDNLSSEAVCLMLLIAACTKSAQFPFSAWLPQAMAAPTPVSALVHSSTLVTAGVYLMIRLSSHFLPCHSWLSALLLLASLTSVMAGIGALVETDLKKIVALSTLSQLGTMVLGLALGAPLLAFFHLVTHALSKSLLFICVGTFISTNKGSQDCRNLKSQLWRAAPVSFAGALLASLSLCGAPFISGFYSKDLILESLWQSSEGLLSISAGALSTALTSAYSIKLIKMCSESSPSSESLPYRISFLGETKFSKGPVMFLSIATLTVGYLMSKNWTIFFSPLMLPSYHKYMAITMLVSGWFLANSEELALIGSHQSPLHHFLQSMFFLENLSSQGSLAFSKSPSFLTFKALEQGWIESISVTAPEKAMVLFLKMNSV
uniref:NADH dehydrogenase subunit 5 n=1 Tax=Scurria scurra TaxID=351200 RepID=UPI001EDECDEB|nr:NADH dehydrogenase subunit 5 [Scurria scurra]UHY95079.1 NADH dehydrogenase subunit 5 [Scurria scurra]